MDLLRYNEHELLLALEGLPAHLRVAFAALCAERLMPAYLTFSRKTGRGKPRVLVANLERLWRDIEGSEIAAEEIVMKTNESMALVPDEDDSPWVEEQACAEDAAAALAYAFRTRHTGRSQEAVWAARRAYEALARYASNREHIDMDKPCAEEVVASHPLVQAELARQRRDLDDLAMAAGTGDLDAKLAALRERAKLDADRFCKGEAPPR